MIVMDVRINNFYAFKDFHMNMSYAKKIVNSPIDGEVLPERENFRFRKVNIIMGSNATGKTTFGKMLMLFGNYMRDGNYFRFAEHINDVRQPATFNIDFVAEKDRLYRFNMNVANKNDKVINCDINIKYVRINKADKYETCAKRLDEGKGTDVSYNEVDLSGWSFQYGDRTFESIDSIENREYTKVLEWVMKTMDPSVQYVEKLDHINNAYHICLNNRSVLLQDGKVISNNIFSSGTKRGFSIAYVIASMLCGMHDLYYCDELFTHVNSDIEIAIVSLMIENLLPYGQLFLTTHNADVSEMDLPKHSFCFFKKDTKKPNKITYVNASEYLKKNTDSVRNALENDVFSTAPNVEQIYRIPDIVGDK